MRLSTEEFNFVIEAIEYYKSHFTVQEIHSYYYNKIQYDKRGTYRMPSDYQIKKIIRMEGFKNTGKGVYIK